MTATEFKEAFNTLYNNINSMASPGFDDYEISLLLTLAQEELVKNYDDPDSNDKREGFEGSTKRRIDLKELIRNYKTSNTLSNQNYTMSPNSVVFQIPTDVFLIKQESAKIESNCQVGKALRFDTVTVIPKTYDEYNKQIKNPFKKPNKNKVWRLDYNSSEPGTNIVELISDRQISEYQMRYLKYPTPIIVNTLQNGLSIDGKTLQSTSELNKEIHSEIVRRAVELSKLSYKYDDLGSFVDLYKRKE